MELEKKHHRVYVKINEFGYITAINSSAFLSDVTGWTQIDSGYGDRFHHAQGNYFSGCILTATGAYRYKLVDGTPVECTAEELREQVNKKKVSDGIGLETRINNLETGYREIRRILSLVSGESVS